jgi:hypothetical protein
VTTAHHDELLRKGPRNAGEPETADEISKRVAHDVSAAPTLAGIVAGATLLAETAKFLDTHLAAIGWLLAAVILVGERLRSWADKLEERR